MGFGLIQFIGGGNQCRQISVKFGSKETDKTSTGAAEPCFIVVDQDSFQ
jgi:hypothetical protein